jgi:hypothetical protein
MHRVGLQGLSRHQAKDQKGMHLLLELRAAMFMWFYNSEYAIVLWRSWVTRTTGLS